MKVLLYPFYRQENWVSDSWWHLLGPTTRWLTLGSRAAALCTHLPLLPSTASPPPLAQALSSDNHGYFCLFLLRLGSTISLSVFSGLWLLSLYWKIPRMQVWSSFSCPNLYWNEVFFFFFHGVQQGQHTVTNIQSFLLTSSVSLSLSFSLRLLVDSVYAPGIRFTEIILVQVGEKAMKTRWHRLNC